MGIVHDENTCLEINKICHCGSGPCGFVATILLITL